MSDLPPGFVLDQPAETALPTGFVIDHPGMAEDTYKGFDAGVAKGASVLLGSLGDLTNLGAQGIGAATNYVERKLGMPESPAFDPSKSVLNKIPTSETMQKEIQKQYYGGAEPYKAQSTPGKLAGSVGEMLPVSALGPGGFLSKMISGVGAGLGSEGARMATEGTPYEPYAQFAGAIGGGLLPSMLGRAVTPIPASMARQRNVDALAAEGVTSLTAGQRTGSKSLQYAESMLGDAPMVGGKASAMQAESQRQFTEAAMRRAGQNLADASPEVLAQNQQRLGNQFEQLSARNTLVPDNQFITELTDTVRHYRRVPDSQQARMLQGYLDDIIPHINAGGMPGVEYQPMRSMLSADSKAVRQSDPYLSRALAGMRNALDDAMGRSISPADRAAWQTARREYGAQKAIEKSASRAGEATAEGQLTPANLRNTVAAENRGAYARGEGQFSDLARAGVGVMSPLPNSGTAQRMNVMGLLNQTLLGAPSALGGRALMSRPVQAYLGNQVAAPFLRENSTAQQALFQALMGASRLKLSDQSR